MTNNNLICDLETGVCGVAGEDEMELIDFNEPQKKVDVYYVTDPMCSHCWALEPVLRRFREQYGHYFNFHTVMGGLLEKWDGGPVDPANGIYGPADVTKHWREVGEFSRMPIDGSLMIDNPVQSSFPPSRVYKIVQKHHVEKADEYLRRVREAVFVFNQNISDLSVLTTIVNQLGLDGEAIVKEAESTDGEQLLFEDFELRAKLGVRGFPTLVMVNEENKGLKIVGSRPLNYYVSALSQILDEEHLQEKPQPALANLLEKENLLFAKEIEEMYDVEPAHLSDWVQSQLASESFDEKEMLGEKYFVNK